MKLIKLTSPHGTPVWVVAAWVIKVSTPLVGEFATGINTVVTMSGGAQGVIEAAEDVVKKLEEI